MSNMLRELKTAAILEALGLSQNESKCYLAVLGLGPSGVSDIAKNAGIHRIDAYRAIKKLIHEGLVDQEVTHRGRIIHPSSLDHLRRIAINKQKNFAKLRWKVEDLIPQLLPFVAKNDERPDVMLIEGREAFLTVANRSLGATRGSTILEVRPAAHDLFCKTFFVSENFEEEYYIPTRLENNLSVCSLVSKSIYERIHRNDACEKRETRLIPKEWDVMSEIYIYDDEVGLVWNAIEPIGLIIKSSTVVTLMKMLFMMTWEKASRSED